MLTVATAKRDGVTTPGTAAPCLTPIAGWPAGMAADAPAVPATSDHRDSPGTSGISDHRVCREAQTGFPRTSAAPSHRVRKGVRVGFPQRSAAPTDQGVELQTGLPLERVVSNDSLHQWVPPTAPLTALSGAHGVDPERLPRLTRVAQPALPVTVGPPVWAPAEAAPAEAAEDAD